MNDLRKAAEMALEALEMLDRRGGLGLDVHEYIRTKTEALRQALNDKPAVKSYCGGKPNYCTPVNAVPGFTVTEPRQSLSRMKPGDRFVLVRTGEIYRIENDGSKWNETRQRPARLHNNSQVRLIVDAVNMTPDRVDETAKGKHKVCYEIPDWKPGMVFPAPKRDSSSWVGLTDEEYDELMLSGDWGGSLIQATEAKLKEKNT